MLEHLPNALTALRIAAVPVLAWLAIVRDGDVFVAVLIACLIGDVVDGRLARALNATSSLGAQLDSIADTLLFLAAAGGIAVFTPRSSASTQSSSPWFPRRGSARTSWRCGGMAACPAFTPICRGLLQSRWGCLLARCSWSANSRPCWLFAAAGLVLVATLEEFILMWLLPEWTADVRGVYWILAQRRETCTEMANSG